MNKKTLQISNGIVFAATVIINYLAATGAFGATVGEMSARYQTYFTPAGYAFSIWTLIYTGLFGFVICQGRSLFNANKDDEIVTQVGWWFVLTSVFNCLWLITWVSGLTGLSVIIMVLLLLSLIQIIFRTRMELDLVSWKKIAFVWWPFSLYSGWITVALIANIAAWLTSIGWSGWGLSVITWAVIMIIVAAMINIAITWTRNMREFALVGVWALVAIAVANRGDVSVIVYTALISAAVVFISSGVHGFINRKSICKELARN